MHKNERKIKNIIQNNGMGSKRPEIQIDGLENHNRNMPLAVGINYDKGGTYGFRPGPIYVPGEWEWPWPQYLGLPTYATLTQWLASIDIWKKTKMPRKNEFKVESDIVQLLARL
jgi:hypothetical protein